MKIHLLSFIDKSTNLRIPSASSAKYYLILLLSFRLTSKLCSTMKNAKRAEIMILDHQEERFPWKETKVSIVALISTPNNVPYTLPTPPVSGVPPITVAAIASISNPRASSTNAPVVFKQNAIPPNVARKPFMI